MADNIALFTLLAKRQIYIPTVSQILRLNALGREIKPVKSKPDIALFIAFVYSSYFNA